MDFIMFTFVFVGLVILFSSFFTVKQQTAVVIERFGKFTSIRSSGLQLKIPITPKFHQLFMEDIKAHALQAVVNRLLGKV